MKTPNEILKEADIKQSDLLKNPEDHIERAIKMGMTDAIISASYKVPESKQIILSLLDNL